MKNQLLLLLTCIVIGALNTFSFAHTIRTDWHLMPKRL